jgi:hypothetical protein
MKMRLLDIFKRKRRVTPKLRIDDPTASWTPREWADMPVHHPRSAEDAR